MDKFTVTDEFVEKYAYHTGYTPNFDILNLGIIYAELNFQFHNLVTDTSKPLYNITSLFRFFEGKGLSLEGSDNISFNVKIDNVKVIFDDHSCQFEGLDENIITNISLDKITEEAVENFFNNFSPILSLLEEDKADALRRLEMIKLRREKEEKLLKLNKINTQVVLDDFFSNRKYVYTINYYTEHFSISANMAHKHVMEFSESYDTFVKHSEAVLDYISKVIATFEEEPKDFHLKIK